MLCKQLGRPRRYLLPVWKLLLGWLLSDRFLLPNFSRFEPDLLCARCIKRSRLLSIGRRLHRWVDLLRPQRRARTPVRPTCRHIRFRCQELWNLRARVCADRRHLRTWAVPLWLWAGVPAWSRVQQRPVPELRGTEGAMRAERQPGLLRPHQFVLQQHWRLLSEIAGGMWRHVLPGSIRLRHQWRVRSVLLRRKPR